jgi:hypothetical protein
MIRRAYRPSCYADQPGQYEPSIADNPKWRDEELGFRLTVDANDAERAGTGRSNVMQHHYATFRLTWDGENT